MIVSAYLGVSGLVDVGYRFYTTAEAPVAARITAGIADAGDGWYSADATIPATAVSVRWDSTGTPTALAREYVSNLDDIWLRPLPGSYANGTAGKIVGTSLPASIAPGAAGGLFIAGSNVPTNVNFNGNITGNLVGNVTGSVHSVETQLTPAEIGNACRDVNNDSPAVGSMGEDIKNTESNMASIGNPWGIAVPGSFPAGTAGNILGNRLDAAVTTRLASSSYVIPPDPATIGVACRDTNNATPAAGSVGDKINQGASAGDPWSTALPGDYLPGTAGDFIGNRLDVNVGSRMDGSTYVEPPSATVIAETTRDITNAAPATGSLGEAVNKSAQVPDPWAVPVPSSYLPGTAGDLIGHNLNATVSSRSTYAGTDTPGTTTLLTRVPGPITTTGGKVDVNDKTGFSLVPEYDAAKSASQAGDAMSLTPAERTALSTAVWQTLTSAMTFVGSIGRHIVDNLNATVGSRLPTASYVAPDNAGIASIKSKTDNLPAQPAAVSDIPTASQNAVATRDVNNQNPAANSLGEDVSTGASGADPWQINLPGSYPPGAAGNIVGTRLDANVSSRLPTANILLNAGQVTVGTNNDKEGYTFSGTEPDVIADAILKRDWQAVSGEPTYCVLNALRLVRNRWEVTPDGTLKVYREDGSAIAWSRTVLSDAAALPITGIS